MSRATSGPLPKPDWVQRPPPMPLPIPVPRLVTELLSVWFQQPWDGPVQIYSAEMIARAIDLERLGHDEWLQIGSCANGDLICIDYHTQDLPVYYVEHESFWEDQAMQLSWCSVWVATRLTELLERLLHRRNVPRNVDDARAWMDRPGSDRSPDHDDEMR